MGDLPSPITVRQGECEQRARRALAGGRRGLTNRGGLLLAAAVVAALAGCGSGGAGATLASFPLRWRPALHLHGVVDLTPARAGGRVVAAAGRRLFLFRPPSGLRPFARGSRGYLAPPRVDEPYIALATGERVARARCSFRDGNVYALAPGPTPRIVTVDVNRRAHPFAHLPAGVFPNGVAFDDVGLFGHRLLVTAASGNRTDLFSLDCRGRVRTVTAAAPKSEGGIAVAPLSFGRYGGDLIAPDENSGNIYAIGPRGGSVLLARSGLPTGGDVGVESLGFVPNATLDKLAAYLADRGTPGNPHPGTDSILSLPGRSLAGAGVAAGDMIAATEGGAETIVIRCRRACRVRRLAAGPTVTHAEGHIVFAARR